MEEIVLEVETITPLFIAGADQKNIENEGLRAPSLRGAMRWWFRAIAGGIKFSSGVLDIKEVKREENEIWGSTEKQSKLSITVFCKGELSVSYFQKRGGGLGYLSYGCYNRPYLEPGNKFELLIRYKPSITKQQRNNIVASIWLLLNLGNIGSKSRKGFGSLRVVEEITVNGIEFKNPATVEELEDYIKRNLKRCLEIFGWKKSIYRSSLLPSFSVIAPNSWKMKILDTIYTSPIDAINDIGEKIRVYREDRANPYARHTRRTRKGYFSYWVTKDYNTVKSIYTSHTPSVPQGSIFGLPHQFQFQSINKKAIVKGTKSERRASPLYIKVWKLNRNQYVTGLQLFKSRFLPENNLLISDSKNQKVSAQTQLPSYNFLENFLNGLQGRWLSL